MIAASLHRHPELVSGSQEICVTREMLKQVQHDEVGNPANSPRRNDQ